MIRTIILSLLLVSVFSCKNKSYQTLEDNLHATISSKIDTLNVSLSELENKKKKKGQILNFKKARRLYKKMEPFIEYYFQGHSRRINGPALPEIKTDDNMVFDASGFQVIEEVIYSDTVDLKELKKQIQILKTDLDLVKQNIKDLPIQNHHFYELLQHQIIRIAALGITGFDSPVALNSIEEANYSVEGIEEFYNLYCDINNQTINENLIDLLKQANQ
jgi:cytochrome c peroxidase